MRCLSSPFRIVRRLAGAAVLASLVPLASAQDTTPVQTSRPALAGPAVPDRAERPTLVEYDFPGKVKRLDSTPEEAAAGLLRLDEAIRAKVERVFADRVRAIDAFVADNLLLLSQLDTVQRTGDTLDQFKLIAEAAQKLAPVWTKGSLRSQVRAVLPADAHAEFERLVGEYWDAIVRERQGAPTDTRARVDGGMGMSMGEPSGAAGNAPPAASKPEPTGRAAKPARRPGRFAIVTEERLASFGKEIERSFDRQLKSGDVLSDYVTNAVKVSDDQRARIRALCNEFAEKTKMDASEKQYAELFVRIGGVLDTQQQLELARFLHGLQKPRTAPPK